MGRQLFIFVVLATMFLTACGPNQNAGKLPDGVTVSVTAEQPLAIGPNPLHVRVTQDDAPVAVQELTVVGDMTHAGMVPVVSEVITQQPDGSYVAEDFVFTMAGDWFVQVDFVLAAGERGEVEEFFTIPAR